MGIKLFSSSSHDNKSHSIFHKSSYSSLEYSSKVIQNDNLPNPRPDNYKIIRHKKIDNFLIIEIKYLDCTNYEGKKILVFEGYKVGDLRKQKLIDPHFCENKRFISPIARFEPTERGWNFAFMFCSGMSKIRI